MHLVRRFLRSLVARRPAPDEREWVRGVLTIEEFGLWERYPHFDQRHTIEVAREVESTLRSTPHDDPRWTAAALLHDVGKVESDLGVFGRVIATVLRGLIGRARVGAWSSAPGWRGEIGRYVDHARRGGALIRSVGGREAVARWAEIHHDVARTGIDPEGTVPPAVVAALEAADQD